MKNIYYPFFLRNYKNI